MNPRTVDILDQALLYSLWLFLACFVLSLTFISWRLRARRKGLADYYQEEFEKRYEQEPEDESSAVPGLLLSDRVRMSGQSLILSALACVACFLILTLTPLSPLGELAGAEVREAVPLRLTRLTYERFHEGFSLQGEVWNQSRQELTSLSAVVSIWGPDQELLDQVVLPLDPARLEPGHSAGFQMRYTENSPILRGYGVSFRTADSRTIAHVTGFEN